MSAAESGATAVAKGGGASGDDLARDTGAKRPHRRDDSFDERGRAVVRDLLGGSAMVSLLAVVVALLVGAVLIAFTNDDVQASLGYFFSRPGDTFAAIGRAVGGAYGALFQGSIFNFSAQNLTRAILPITVTLQQAAPLIIAGLGVAVAFRAGMFNIGGRGQMLVGAACAGYVAVNWSLPPVIHLLVSIIAGIVGGAIWAGIAGVLKARTGAHEVIVTIMLNYVGLYLVSWLLTQQGLLQAPGQNSPKSAPVQQSAVIPTIFGAPFQVDYSIVIAVIATVAVWWLINQSSLGFKLRAFGENPDAARTAGMSVGSLTVWAMVIAGGLAGLASATIVQGTAKAGFGSGVDSGIGFDAITVALLGRSRPWGVFGAGLLFGALKAGGYTMQAAQGVPLEVILVVQSVIVLFIAAPPLVRAMFHLPTPGVAVKPRAKARQNAAGTVNAGIASATQFPAQTEDASARTGDVAPSAADAPSPAGVDASARADESRTNPAPLDDPTKGERS